MDPFRLCLALGPLAIYLLLLGLIHLSRRPFIVAGARDTAALGVGVSGMMVVGPIELLLPPDAVNHFGPYVWLLLATIYSLCLSLFVLLGRPRLVIYNISTEEFRPVLAEVIESLDDEARWAGSSLVLPQQHVELHLESSPSLRNVSLVAASDTQSYAGWRRLETALAARLRPVEATPSLWGLTLTMLALAMIGKMTWIMVRDAQAVTEGFHEMLRF